MTVTITIAGGRTKRALIEMALEFCGIAGYSFEHSPDEIAGHLRTLDVMMTEWPFNQTSYVFPAINTGTPEDESGLSDEDVPAVYMSLAARIAQGIGKQLSIAAAGQIVRTFNSISSRYSTIPTGLLAPSTVVGSGASRLIPFVNETGE